MVLEDTACDTRDGTGTAAAHIRLLPNISISEPTILERGSYCPASPVREDDRTLGRFPADNAEFGERGALSRLPQPSARIGQPQKDEPYESEWVQ